MKISKRTREQAALILATSASSGLDRWMADSRFAHGLPQRAVDLAEEAWMAAMDATPGRRDKPWNDPEIYAEAESLLRTGWSP